MPTIPTSPDFPQLIAAARGEQPADLLLRNARLINVHLGEIMDADVAVAQGRIIGFGSYRAIETIDLKGRFMAPGFIDGHVHIESAMVGPAEYAKTILPHGTTAVVADPHEIANVLGIKGIEYMLQAGSGQPVHYFFTLPSCVPATLLENAGANLSATDLAPLMGRDQVVGLAEMMNFPGVIFADPQVLEKLALAAAEKKPCDGHAPGLTGFELNAYLTAGVASDHECTTVAEAREKLSKGMHIMVREGTGAHNLDDLLPAITPATSHRMMWCTDDRHPHDLMDTGHIDSMVRRAILKGLDPVIAIQMATVNSARYFGLREIGALTPGRLADFILFSDLKNPVIEQVYTNGRLVAEHGRMAPSAAGGPTTEAHGVAAAVNVDVHKLNPALPAETDKMRLIQVVPNQIVTISKMVPPTVRNGLAVSDPKRDILKIIVVERHKGTGQMGIGFISGFGLQHGALASTVAHDSHNIIAVGVDDSDLLFAIQCLVEMGGGFTVVNNGSVLAQLPLPIAGLMSTEPMDHVRRNLDAVTEAARQLGTTLPDPFMTLGFMALPVIPELKITDRGLVDVGAFDLVPLFEKE